MDYLPYAVTSDTGDKFEIEFALVLTPRTLFVYISY